MQHLSHKLESDKQHTLNKQKQHLLVSEVDLQGFS